MVEQWTHKPLVVGSNPTLATHWTIRVSGSFLFFLSLFRLTFSPFFSIILHHISRLAAPILTGD